MKLRKILAGRLGRTDGLLEAASLCRSAALSDDGAGAFLLFAFYFESVVLLRESTPMDAGRYETAVSELLTPLNECLVAIERFDPVKLIASLDSFARTVLRLKFP